jgi:hypothetical protein
VLETDPYYLDKFGTSIGIVYDATIWRSHGNYGSTKFDPMGLNGRDEFLEAYICDSCLTENGDLIYHVDAKITRTEEVRAQTYLEHEKVRHAPSRNSSSPDSSGEQQQQQ